MFAEQLVIDLPAIPDLTAVPPWVWWAVAAVCWYLPAGRVVRNIRRNNPLKDAFGEPAPPATYAALWAFSPAACVILGLMGVTVAAIFVLWTVGHFASLGAIPAPWEKDGKPAGGRLVPPQGGSGTAPTTSSPDCKY